ncbi:MAG: choice-of-anchor Q domain-containing protein [Marinicella sp.]
MRTKILNIKKTALVSALLLELTAGAHAATINVDGTTCTLNDAVTAADTDTATGGCSAGSGADVLELPIDGNLILAAPTGTINTEVTINGNGSVIDGNDTGRIFTVQAGGNLTINDSIVTNGVSSTADRNFAGGVRSYDGQLHINRSTFSEHVGGAINFTRSTGSITDSVIENNDSYGAAAYYYNGGLTVSSSTVTVSNSTISGNNTMSGTAGGGGIYVGNFDSAVSLTMTNSTISGNTSVNRGGGISHTDYGNGSTISLTNVTIIDNTSNVAGGGIANDASTITISQSIVSGNTGTAGSEVYSSGGTVTVDDFNLFGFNNNAGVVGVTIGATDIVPTEANVTGIVDTTLSDNGGSTPTHALVTGSPAIDAVPAASCASVTDQTAKNRPIDGNVDGTADCDIGAFENPNPDIIFEDGFE